MARMVAGLAAMGLMASAAMAAGPLAKDVVLAIHGGTAGKADRDEVSDERLRAEMTKALDAGYAALQKSGATGLDGVEAAIRVLEDSPYFNAGKGAVFTHEGRNELDASIMEGKTLKAGAVASVTIIKNPITAARAVMEKTKHVLLVSRGAEVFASKMGLEIVDPSYFWTEPRWKEIQKVWEREQKREEKRAARRAKAAGAVEVRKDGAVALNVDETDGDADDDDDLDIPHRWGTVGAIALDAAGNLAAGTSTGGLNNKMFGRVGDSPIIGAGTYADNEGCAVSGTGQGEYFIRLSVAHDINALMKYQKQPVESAAETVIKQKLKALGGDGGAIALDAKGNFAAPYNTEGMHRGYVTRDGKTHVLLYSE